jgi:hypothetical protein
LFFNANRIRKTYSRITASLGADAQAVARLAIIGFASGDEAVGYVVNICSNNTFRPPSLIYI